MNSSKREFDLSIYLVTDSAQCGSRGVVQTAIDAVAGGVTTVQLRVKTMTDDDAFTLLLELARALDGRATLLINDRIDVYCRAAERGAQVHGVHVGQGDLTAAAVRDRVGPHAIVGLTANTPSHLDAASQLPKNTIDYLGVGVIHSTSTKPDHPAVLGVDGFAQIATRSSLPCVAIGGIAAKDVHPLRLANAAGVAVVSEICAATNARRAAQTLTKEWNR